MIDNIINFNNKKIDPGIISEQQIYNLVAYCLEAMLLEGDVVEFGSYVGESSKYLMRCLLEVKSNKQLYCIDSFEGLPDLGESELNTGWRAGTLKTTQDVITANFLDNDLPLPKIIKSWFKDVTDLPDKVCFAFLDGDFYSSIYESLEKIYDRVVDGGYIVFHDYKRNDLPGVEKAINDFFSSRGISVSIHEACNQLGVLRKNRPVQIFKNPEQYACPITLVTGIWDLGRDKLQEGWSRNYSHYISNFNKLLDVEANMIVFGDAELRSIVFKKRNKHNTLFVERSLNWFKNNDYYSLIQGIRNNPEWSAQAGWLQSSTQACLEMYNPLVMSKMFLLHDAKIFDPFNSKFLFWVDGGITNTVHSGYFTHDKVLDKLVKYITKFSFVCFPYDANNEIHGFNYDKLNQIAEARVKRVARAGFFGGPKDTITDINNIYYNLLLSTLRDGFMGTEESIFSIMAYKHSDLINYFDINHDGLFGTFFENLKNDKLEVKNEAGSMDLVTSDVNNAGLYIITYNSPEQVRTLLESMKKYDNDFILKPKKFLLDNSKDLSTTDRYLALCEEYGMTHIKKDNIGICGGRQFIAEHAEEIGLDFYFFFEDDMLLYDGVEPYCINGFARTLKNLYSNSLQIVQKEKFDFLKLSFTEFYGDNKIQWAWYNVPQVVRDRFWPNNKKLPQMGLDPNAPRTEFNNIGCYKGISYVDGDIYYCNWPQVVTRAGNKKMFLDTKWAHPFEQTWMSHMYQQTKEGELRSGLLLASPINHHRFAFYKGEERVES